MNKLPLSGFKSLCAQKAPIIVSQDTGIPRKHIGHNIHQAFVTHYKIDGEVIQEGKRCDFLLINEDKHIAYLIELKGRDLTKAVEQLIKTEEALRSQLQSYSLRFRIVASQCRTQEIHTSKFNKFRIQKGKSLVYSTNSITENI